MGEAIALLLVIYCASHNWFSTELVGYARSGLNKWAGFVQAGDSLEGLSEWVCVVLIPACLLGFISVLFNGFISSTLISVAVLMFLIPYSEFKKYAEKIINSINHNDRENASKQASEWRKDDFEIEDGEKRYTERMLGFCALRLQHDLVGVIFWYGILGIGGAGLYFAHMNYRVNSRQLAMFSKLIEVPADWFTIMLFGISGNYSRAVNKISGGHVEQAALAAAHLDSEVIDIERIIPYWHMLQRTFWFAVGCAVIILILLFR